MAFSHNIIVSCPNNQPIQYVLNTSRVGIGRAADNQIRVDLDYISYAHCELVEDGDGYRIRDLESKNGIRVNGEKVDDYLLGDGDRILLSEYVAAYYLVLPENEEPQMAAERGPEESEDVASEYVDLDSRVSDMNQKLGDLETHYQERLGVFDELVKSIEKLQGDIETKMKGEDQSGIREMQAELTEKTQHISLVKEDLEETRKHILTTTAKVHIRPDDL